MTEQPKAKHAAAESACEFYYLMYANRMASREETRRAFFAGVRYGQGEAIAAVLSIPTHRIFK